MTQKDAYMFPIIGSAMLFGLYVLFKIFDKDVVNLILSLYFALIIVFTMTSMISMFLSAFIKRVRQCVSSPLSSHLPPLILTHVRMYGRTQLSSTTSLSCQCSAA